MPVNHAVIPEYYARVSDGPRLSQCARLLDEAHFHLREAYKTLIRESSKRGDAWPWTSEGLCEVERIFATADACFLRDLAAVICMSARDGRIQTLDLDTFQSLRAQVRSKQSVYTDEQIAKFKIEEHGADRSDWLHDAGHLTRDNPTSASSPNLQTLYAISGDIWLIEYRLQSSKQRAFVYVVEEPDGPMLMEIPGHMFSRAMIDIDVPGSANFVFIQ